MTFDRRDIRLMKAHTLGFFCGFNEGCEKPLEGYDDEEALAYRIGYDMGVAQYCSETHLEDEEEI